jgi:hypothetical protein
MKRYTLPLSYSTLKLYWYARFHPQFDPLLHVSRVHDPWQIILGLCARGHVPLLIQSLTMYNIVPTQSGWDEMAHHAVLGNQEDMLLYLLHQCKHFQNCCSLMYKAYELDYYLILLHFNTVCNHTDTKHGIVHSVQSIKPLNLQRVQNVLNAIYYQDLNSPDPTQNAIDEWKRIKTGFEQLVTLCIGKFYPRNEEEEEEETSHDQNSDIEQLSVEVNDMIKQKLKKRSEKKRGFKRKKKKA